MKTREPHHKFKLNGLAFDAEELKEVGYSLIKEGEPFEQSIGDFLLDWGNDQPTITVKTSGSTGIPKLISLQKEHMVNSALASGMFFGLEPGNSALLCINAEFIAGKMMLVRALVLGLEIDYVEPSSRPLDFVVKPYDFCAMVPMQLASSLAKIDQIKTLIVGGAPLSSYVLSKLQRTTSRIFETYGMTETSTHIAVKRIDNVKSSLPGRKAGTVETPFKTLPSVKVSKDQRDCLVIDAPDITSEKIITNDVVDLISESEFQWLGRYDNVINSGGVKLFPEQIEVKLAPLMKNRFFLAGLPDAQLGEKLVLIVECEIEPQGLHANTDFLGVLEKYEIPKKIIPITQFVETGSGKIDRKKTIAALETNMPK